MSSKGVTRREVTGVVAGATGVVGLSKAATADETIEVNVGLENAAGERAVRRAATEIVREFAFDALTARLSREAAETIRSAAGVRYVEHDGRMRTAGQVTPAGIEKICADETIEAGIVGEGADVAVIDTGIDADHPDLETNLGAGTYAVACEGSDCVTGWDDDNGHGTHVAGVVGAANNSTGVVGVAPDATLHAVKVLDSSGAGSYSDIAAGIEYTADQGWDVANLSVAGGFSSTVQDACVYAYNNGVLLVAAAGNDGPCSDCVAYPAAFDECVGVGAVDQNCELSSFSSTGPEAELVAPGEDVLSTVPGGGTGRRSGTSVACPHVSGVGALLMARGASAPEARRRMRETANDLGYSSDEQGAGLVKASDAVGV